MIRSVQAALVLLVALLMGGTRSLGSNLADTEVMVLQRAAQAVGCPPDISVNDAVYSFYCMMSPGHLIDASVQRFPGEAEAQAAFETARGDNPIQYFHGYQAYEIDYGRNPDDPIFPLRHRVHSWQASRWLIAVHTFDDTDCIAPLMTVSEAIYQAAIEYGLFPFQVSCTIYLPLIFGR